MCFGKETCSLRVPFKDQKQHQGMTKKGRVCTGTLNEAALWSSLRSNNLSTNERMRRKMALTASNKAPQQDRGSVTPLMKWIQRRPVRGSSVEWQKKKGERRENYGPGVSAQGDHWSWSEGNAEALGLGQSVQPAGGMHFEAPRGTVWIFLVSCNSINTW